MRKPLFFIGVFILALTMLSSCDLFNSGDMDWLETSREWTDEDDSQLSFLDQEDTPIDIGWYTDPNDRDTWVMGFISDYTYSGGTLEGTYTSFQNDDSDEEFNITIDFTYSGGILTAVVDADGVLGNKTLNLEPADMT